MQPLDLGPLTDDLLTRDVRVFQRAKGHRFSVDDMATAYVAVQTAPTALRALDLGCGLGSVLLHLAWSLPEAHLVGVEAQAMSFELLQRNVARNGYTDRVRVLHGDLRDARVVAQLGADYPLITGTPPYFPLGTALDAEDEQRAYARVEYRGGVEAYIATAAQLLAPGGVLILCGDSDAEGRVQVASDSHGLALHSTLEVLPKAGAKPLFSVWTLGRGARTPSRTQWWMRDAKGDKTPEALRLKAFSGF